MPKALIEIAALALLLAWVVYPIAMFIVAHLRHRAGGVAAPNDLTASFVIATRENAEVISKRIANIESHRDELRSLQIIVSIDRSARTGVEEYRQVLDGRAIVVEGDHPGGKAATLNAAVRTATHDIVIFSDSAQEFLPGAMKSLVETLQQPAVGAVTGHLRQENNRRSVILRIFWAYEAWLREMESSFDSIVGVTGAIYAMRRALWEPLPAGLICDDLYVPFRVVQRGSRVVKCDAAIATDVRVFTPREEFRRKVRNLTGNLQLCALYPSILNPLQNRVWVQFVCHKLLRLFTPFALILGALGVALASPPQLVLVTVASAVAVVVLARTMAPRESLIARIVRQAGWTALILSAPFVATLNALRGNWNVWSASGSGVRR